MKRKRKQKLKCSTDKTNWTKMWLNKFCCWFHCIVTIDFKLMRERKKNEVNKEENKLLRYQWLETKERHDNTTVKLLKKIRQKTAFSNERKKKAKKKKTHLQCEQFEFFSWLDERRTHLFLSFSNCSEYAAELFSIVFYLHPTQNQNYFSRLLFCRLSIYLHLLCDYFILLYSFCVRCFPFSHFIHSLSFFFGHNFMRLFLTKWKL